MASSPERWRSPGCLCRRWRPAGALSRGVHLDALEPDYAVHPTALDGPLALQLESELDEERRRGREVVDDDAHVLHAVDRQALDGSGTGVVTNARRHSRTLAQTSDDSRGGLCGIREELDAVAVIVGDSQLS